MIVFSVDASGLSANVCVMQDKTVLFDKTLNEGLTHSETLLVLVDEAFKAAQITPRQVGVYTITKGPGSFTGLRIGIALVQGLALPFNTPAVGVSTLEALAIGSGLEGRVVPALNARRGEVYWAAFECTGGVCTRLHEDAANPVEELAQKIDFTAHTSFFVGDGAKMCYNANNYGLPAPPANAFSPDYIAKGAAMAGFCVYKNGEAEVASKLRPSYLRLSQAERERAERLQAK